MSHFGLDQELQSKVEGRIGKPTGMMLPLWIVVEQARLLSGTEWIRRHGKEEGTEKSCPDALWRYKEGMERCFHYQSQLSSSLITPSHRSNGSKSPKSEAFT